MLCILEGNLIPPRLTQGLESSLSASNFDCVFDCVTIILFCDDACAIYTRGLERILSACLSDNSYAVYTKGLEMSKLVLLSPVSHIFGWGLERSLSACEHSHGLERTGWIVLKGI